MEELKLEDVIEVINQSKTIIEVELAGIRTGINILLNPELNKKAEEIADNKEILKLLIKILDKAFNSYYMNENIINLFLVDSKGFTSYFNLYKSNIHELINSINELDKFKELEGVPEMEDIKNAVGMEFSLEKLTKCYELLNKELN